MNPTPYTLEVAVLRIFRDELVFHAGGALCIRQLRDAWVATGLRSEDLDTGIDRLVAKACVETDVDAHSGAPVVRLLVAGADRLRQVPHHLADWIEEVKASAALELAARRPAWPQSSHRHRRRSDAMPASGSGSGTTSPRAS